MPNHSVRNLGSGHQKLNCGGQGGTDGIVEGRKLHCPGLEVQESLEKPLAWERERPSQGVSCLPLQFHSAGELMSCSQDPSPGWSPSSWH